MGYQTERDEFLSIMGAAGVRVSVSRAILASAGRLQKLAELACSSERADRDQVRCPAAKNAKRPCLCSGYGSFGYPRVNGELTHEHGTVPRYMLTESRIERQIKDLCAGHNLVPDFQGDPRGAVVSVYVSGSAHNRERGIAVPARGYSVAQMERMCR